jgi:ATP synthase protein I
MTEQGPGQRPDQGADDDGRSGGEGRAEATGTGPIGANARPAGRVQPAGLVTVATGGFEFAVAILLGVFAGQWLDRRIGTGPWLVILGVVVGAAAGFYNLYRTLTTVRPRVASRGSGTGSRAGGSTAKGDGEHGGTG